MSKFFIVLCVLVAVCLVVDARRDGSRRGNRRARPGRRGIPADAQNITQWVRVLPGDNVQAQESAYSVANQVVVLSKDKRALRNAGFKPSITIYDFRDGSVVTLLKVKKFCFLMESPQGLAKDSLLTQISTYAGETRAETPTVEMFVTDLSPEQSATLQARPELTSMCRSKKPVMAISTVQPANMGEGRQSLLASTLESFVNISKERGRGRRRGGKGKKDRRGGRGRRGRL